MEKAADRAARAGNLGITGRWVKPQETANPAVAAAMLCGIAGYVGVLRLLIRSDRATPSLEQSVEFLRNFGAGFPVVFIRVIGGADEFRIDAGRGLGFLIGGSASRDKA